MLGPREQSNKCSSERVLKEWPVRDQRPSTLPETAKVQHIPHRPWFFTGETTRRELFLLNTVKVRDRRTRRKANSVPVEAGGELHGGDLLGSELDGDRAGSTLGALMTQK